MLGAMSFNEVGVDAKSPRTTVRGTTEVNSVKALVVFQLQGLVFRYRLARRRFHNSDSVTGEVPPTYPTFIPFLGSAISLIWDTALFCRVATSYRGSLTSTRISLFGSAIYIFQDRETVCRIMRQRNNLTPISIRFVLPAKHLFGMPEGADLDAYRVDNSGPLEKPCIGSTVPAQDRIDYLHHQAFQRALIGPGLAPTILRFRSAIRERLRILGVGSSEWMEVDDLFVLLGKAVSSALTEAIFGPSLLTLHPDFIDNLWEYDSELPWLIRMIPRWIYPNPHNARDKVLKQIKEWHAYARQASREDYINLDNDSDPYWGSQMVRHLHQALVGARKHSDDAMAAHDLGLIWGATSNSASAAALAAFHIFDDCDLLIRVRSELSGCLCCPLSSSSFDALDAKQLNKLPLLSSIYSETLRLHSGVFLMLASPPDTDIHLGKWKFPRRSFGLVSPALAHMDESFWNTKDDMYPVDKFWAERFLVNPSDPSSGPIRPESRGEGMSERLDRQKREDKSDSEPYYSTTGLEGSWIPYGAGVGMCPGRFLAKDVIISTCALLASEYDVEILTETLDMDPWRFGLSVGRPRSPIAARIRKR
ncbi:cytochrome P450 [Hypoxylon sp. FL1857]|nr:cytochrome P450 [Hypoxylon sp. FL1857]